MWRSSSGAWGDGCGRRSPCQGAALSHSAAQRSAAWNCSAARTRHVVHQRDEQLHVALILLGPHPAGNPRGQGRGHAAVAARGWSASGMFRQAPPGSSVRRAAPLLAACSRRSLRGQLHAGDGWGRQHGKATQAAPATHRSSSTMAMPSSRWNTSPLRCQNRLRTQRRGRPRGWQSRPGAWPPCLAGRQGAPAGGGALVASEPAAAGLCKLHVPPPHRYIFSMGLCLY